MILPGKNNIFWYICSAVDPRPVWKEPVKRNNQTIILFILTTVFWVFTSVRVWIYKRSTSGVALPQVATLQKTLDKQSLVNMATILISLLFFIPGSLVVVSLNNILQPQDLMIYPNYLLIDFMNHHLIFLWNFCSILILFIKSEHMRTAVYRELKQRLSFW